MNAKHAQKNINQKNRKHIKILRKTIFNKTREKSRNN